MSLETDALRKDVARDMARLEKRVTALEAQLASDAAKALTQEAQQRGEYAPPATPPSEPKRWVRCVDAEPPSSANGQTACRLTAGKTYEALRRRDGRTSIYDDNGNHFELFDDRFVPCDAPAEAQTEARFKVGDRVRCVESTAEDSDKLTAGKEYDVQGTVPDGTSYLVRVVTNDGFVKSFYANRFVLADVPDAYERMRADYERIRTKDELAIFEKHATALYSELLAERTKSASMQKRIEELEAQLAEPERGSAEREALTPEHIKQLLDTHRMRTQAYGSETWIVRQLCAYYERNEAARIAELAAHYRTFDDEPEIAEQLADARAALTTERTKSAELVADLKDEIAQRNEERTKNAELAVENATLTKNLADSESIRGMNRAERDRWREVAKAGLVRVEWCHPDGDTSAESLRQWFDACGDLTVILRRERDEARDQLRESAPTLRALTAEVDRLRGLGKAVREAVERANQYAHMTRADWQRVLDAARAFDATKGDAT